MIGECKWTGAQLGPRILSDLEAFKIPALRQAGVRFASGGPLIALFAKSGFKDSLVRAVDGREDVTLVRAEQLVEGIRDARSTSGPAAP